MHHQNKNQKALDAFQYLNDGETYEDIGRAFEQALAAYEKHKGVG